MMFSTNEDDPFLQVQTDVLNQISQTRALFTSYLRIRSLTASPNSPELLSARSELSGALDSLTEDLSDLIASVEAVESDPYKYGIDIEEVARRKRLCDEVGREVNEMQQELAKGFSANSASAFNSEGRVGADSREIYSVEEEERNDYAGFEQQQQLHIMAEQDQQLDSVSQTVHIIRQQASDMGRELEEQAAMLDRVDGLADRVGGRLQNSLKTMGTVIKRNEDGLSSCCIAGLIFILIVLLILVLVL